MVRQHILKKNGVLKLFAVIIAIGLATSVKSAPTRPDVEFVPVKNILRQSVPTQASVLIVKETIQPHQNIAQYTSKCSSYKDLVCCANHRKRNSFIMRLLSLNCQSWSTAKSSVTSITSNYNLDILCLSETWEKDTCPIHFKSWSTFSKPRKNNEGHGGVAILSKASEDFYIKRRQDLEKDNVEAICADIVLKDGFSFLLIVAYIPPDQTEQMKMFSELLKSCSSSKNVIITGDFNAKSQEWHNTTLNGNGKILENFLHESHYVCLNDGKPTRRKSNSVIDLFITNPNQVPKISLCETLTYEAVQSDHIGILLEICDSCSSVGNILVEKYMLGKTDWNLWEECTKDSFENWNSLSDSTEWESVEEMYCSFKTVFDECREKSVPKRNVQNVNRRRKPPWWNDRMTEIKKRLNNAKRTYKRRSTQSNFETVASVESEFKIAEEEEKDKWVESLCDKITYSSTPKEMWDTFKTLTTYQDLDGGNILPLLDKDNNPVFDLDQKCQILQDTFFSGSHLSENNFDDTFKEEIESELADIHRQETEDQIYDDDLLNDEISIAVPKIRESGGTRQDFHRAAIEVK